MKTIDCNTHYWPVDFLDRVNHSDKGYIGREENDRFYVSAASYEPYLPEIAKQWSDNHKIIIGSDFDHGDPIATWPHTISDLEAMEDLGQVDRDRILGLNAAELFGLQGAA